MMVENETKEDSVCVNISDYFQECTECSSIHGVKFIGDKKRSWFERLLWFTIVSISVITCSIFVEKTYEKWVTSPVFVTIGTNQIPIHHIPFPAVTVCPESKSDRDIFYFPDVWRKVINNDTTLTEKEYLEFEYMSLVCNRTYGDVDLLNVGYYNESIFEFFSNVTPNFNITFVKCFFASNKNDCSEMFTPLFTRDGLCFTFNILDRSELFSSDVIPFLDYTVAPKSVCYKEAYSSNCKNPYPRRPSFAGVDAGLKVQLRISKKNFDEKCGAGLQSFKIILHDPGEIPTQNHNFVRMSLDSAMYVAVSPQVMITKEELRKYDRKERKCYYDNEKKLTRFKHYSQSNCEVECLTYIMEELLLCSDFYLPQTHNASSICSAGHLSSIRVCEKFLINYITNRTNLNLTPFELLLNDIIKEHNITELSDQYCECLPPCSSISYGYDTTQTDYFWYHLENDSSLRNEEYRALLQVYFKDAHYIPMQREEMFGYMDFVAYCGGLLGLFMGFSFVSLIEIIYFLTLRIGLNVHKFGKKYWHGYRN